MGTVSSLLHVPIHSSCVDFGESRPGSGQECEVHAPAISLHDDYQNETSSILLRTGRKAVGTWTVAVWAVVVTVVGKEASLLSTAFFSASLVLTFCIPTTLTGGLEPIDMSRFGLLALLGIRLSTACS
ncbi:hypothetical protein ARMSODRAFT_103212 [Armillaria solidipes]|uniref:Uncharacterized protein n=1 Tax=Armillaria solidipes TaxID=1076256 RepID=A0A2H3ALY1_9AGAR|nr:hypothetical protein ARMSODRAFT_103212 [Armillaria solidipes]